MLKHFCMLFYIRIVLKAATIPCSVETNTKFAHIEINGSNRTVVCHDDMADLSSYTFNQNITLDGQWHKLLVAAANDVFTCNIACTGCYGSTQNDCFTCSSLGRGTKPLFPTFSQFTSVTPYSCPCRGNYTDDNSKDCKCPDGYSTKRSTTDDIISCEKCPIIYATCKYDNTTNTTVGLTCATGTNRTTNITSNCSCQAGYQDVQNTADCTPLCNKPCSTCVTGSQTSCATCISPMVLNNAQCQCPQGQFQTVSGTNYSCNACHATCLTCNGANIDNCLSCDPLTSRVFQSGSCPCPQFYVPSNSIPICVRCDPSCLTCTDQISCATCLSGSNRYIQNAGDLCTCMPGFAENPSNPVCVACHQSCQTCQDSYTVCTSCPSGSLRQLINYECVCMNKYFDDGSIKCQACDYTCLTCNGNNNDNCVTCDTSKNRVLNNQKQCVCQQGYGYIDLQTEQCQVCNNFCKTCDQINNCLSCDITLHRILQDPGTCPCDNGYYQANSLCVKCHATCLQCFGTDQNSCISCDLDAGRVLKNNQCQCNLGYFSNQNNECKQCYYSCVACVNEFFNGCIQCDPSRTLNNSQCICPITQIDDGVNSNCQSCHYSCQTCNGQQNNNCLTCFDNSLVSGTINRILQYSQCICPPRWFDDQVNEKCKPCHKSCLTCFNTDQYSCISCSDIDHRLQQSNSCICQDGYTETSQNVCAKCDYRCSTCAQDINNCLTCPIGSQRNLQKQSNPLYNTCACAPGAGSDIQDNPICQSCHYSCQNCLGPSANQCTSCDSNLNRQLSTTFCTCKQGYYDINAAECSSINFYQKGCSLYCLDCKSTPSNCTSCNQNDFRQLSQNQCICGTRFGTQSLSYYDVGDTQCQACHYTCYTCNGSSYQQCLTCDSVTDLRQLVSSQCKCLTGYLDYGTPNCQKCDDRCQTCALQRTQCTSCPLGSLRVLNVQAQTCDCPSGYFDPGVSLCQVCDITCQQCSDRANKCLSCKNGQNRTYNQLLSSCDCLVGYYDVGDGSCSICHFSCTSCSGPLQTDCVTCPNYKTTFRVLNQNQCICQDQYFDDNQNKICQPCSQTCYTCKNTQNFCLLCQSGQNRVLQSNQCACISGYFESGSLVCAKCSQNCLECQNNSLQCTKCGTSRMLNGGTCICQTGFYDDGTLICKQCDASCLTCQNNSTICTTCDSTKFRTLQSNKCICPAGLLDVGVPLCQPCDVRCLTCQSLITQCTSCDTSNRILKGTQCACKDSYFENAVFQCQQCDQTCLTCQGTATFCSSCPGLTKINSLGQCKCQDGTYSDVNGICQTCSYKCLTCLTSSNNCQTCNQDRKQVLNSCICLDGSYDSGISLCQKCSYQCTTCALSASNCLTCSSISQRKLQGQNCVCLQGYYDAGSLICAKCSYTCLTCMINQSNCTSCDTTLNRVQIGTQCNCNTGYFDDGAICQLCHYSCLTCSQQSTNCTSCDIGLTFRTDKSTNFSQCPCSKGFFDDGTKVCKQCSYNCIDCAQTSTNCTICNNNPAYSRINLIPTCQCQDGYYDDGIQPICLKCSIGCLTCINSATNCLICESPLTRQSIPKCDCRDGYFINPQQKCSQCSVKCLTCVSNQYNCLSCQPDRITKQCLCKDGYYEANQLLCQQCSPKCQTCENDKLNCLTCQPDRINPPNCVCKYHYYDNFINTECQECDQYCGSCDLSGCIDCAANRIQSLKTCVCPINSISYTDTPYCSTCTIAVVSGIFSDDLSTIQYTFEYPLQFNFPHKVDVQAQCQQIITNSSMALLGQSPLCTIDNKTLQIQLGDGSTVLVGDQIEFNSDLLKHQDCDNQTISKVIRTKINSPINFIKPIVKLNYPSQASPCSQIQVRISYQNITGERNLLLLWSSSLTLNSIEQANQLQYQTLTIESGELPEKSNIDIQLHFVNFLNQSDQVNINFTTLSYQTPQFGIVTTQTQFIQWSPIKLTVFYDNEICSGVSSKSQVSIDFSELNRTNNSSPIKFQQSSFKSFDSQAMVSAIIPARTLTYDSNYTILVTYQDSSNTLSQEMEIFVIKSPIIVQIVDGTRIQNYLKTLSILIQAKDPDQQTEWNKDKYINIEVTCSDVQTLQPCVVNNKTLKLNSTYRQDIPPRSFNPFNVVIFKVTASKGNMQSTDSATIIFLDAELPALNIQYPQGYTMRDVNINEKLQFQAMQSSKDIDYSYALVYDFEIVYIANVPSQFIKFAIWDNFINFNSINTISVRILAHDIKYLMPQACSIQLSVNMPPVGSIISISPQYGNAYFTNFIFRVTNSRDSDTPVSYRFAYYQNQTLFDSDIKNGFQDNLIILQDFSSIQSYSGILESGDLIILVSVADSLGSTANYTQKVKSLSFYETQQFQTQNSSVCINFVTQLANVTNLQQQLILTQEFIKLYQSNITADCQQKVYQIISQYQENLFAQLGQSSILTSRIQMILSQIFGLEQQSIRILNEQQEMCYNTSSKFMQFNYLDSTQIQNETQLKSRIDLISIQINRSVQHNIQYTSDYQTTLDFGDDQTYRNIQQNIIKRKGLIKLLEGLYSQASKQQYTIRNYINILLDSFQINLELDQQGIKIKQSNVGVYVNKLSQSKFSSFIIPDISDSELQDLSSFNINRFVQIAKYPSNYIQNVTSQLIQQNITNSFKYEQYLLQFDNQLYDPFIYVENGNSTIQVNYIYQGSLNYNFDFNPKPCNSSNLYQPNSNYSIACANFRDNLWRIDECVTSNYLDKHGNMAFSCQCSQLNPITLMIINTTNITINQNQKTYEHDRLQELIDLGSNYNVSIVVIFIILLILTRFSKNKLILSEIREKYNQWMLNHEIGLTQKPVMSTALLKQIIKYLHQVTRIYNVSYTHISQFEQILILTLNVNVIITILNLFNDVLNQSYLPIPVTFFVALLFEIVGKIFEGFFTGPKILKIIGYTITIILNLGILFVNIIINMSNTNQILFIIILIGLIIFIYGPVEIVIQHTKLKLAFSICALLEEEPLNPVINLAYYFIQDEVILLVVKGGQIAQLYDD